MRNLVTLASLLALTLTLSTTSAVQAAPGHQMMGKKLGLEGYCPVCIIKAKKWVMGSPQHESTYDGMTYRFPSAAEKAVFEKSPAQFVPALAGDCTVCLANAGKRVPGNIRHAALHNNRLYLFPSNAEKQVFMKNTAKYENVDLAEKGNCIVCRVKAGKTVPGKTQYTSIKNGFRYLFPSMNEQRVFDNNVDQFVTTSRKANKNTNLVMISGRGGCAACEHGITPIGSPQELGLAVNTRDGQIFVVENAHRLYPQIYKGRYNSPLLNVTGKVVRKTGHISWIAPQSVTLAKK